MWKWASTHNPNTHNLRKPRNNIVKLSNYQLKVQRVGSNLYRFIPLSFDHLPTVHPFITVDDSYWLLQCKPSEVDDYIVKLSKALGTKDLESMNHFYTRLAKDSSSPLQSEPVKAYHKPSEFLLSHSKRQQAMDRLERGKFHHHTYKYGTFWDFLAGVWWGDHFND